MNNSVNSFALVNESSGRGKYVAGTYFEIAIHNFFKTIDFVLRRVNIRKSDKQWADGFAHLGNWTDERMGKVLEQLALAEMSPTQLSRLSRLLYHHFPFFSPIMADAADHQVYLRVNEIKEIEQEITESDKKIKKNPVNKELVQSINEARIRLKAAHNSLERQLASTTAKEVLAKLAVMAYAMNFYRNQYSHKCHFETLNEKTLQEENEQNLAFWLEVIFKGARSIILDRKEHSQEDTKFLTQDGNLHYNVNKSKKSTRNPNFYFSPGKKNGQKWLITDFGRYYFCSLFLQRSDAIEFGKNVGLYTDSPFKLSNEERNKLQLEEKHRALEEQKIVDKEGDGHKVNPRIISNTESVQNTIIQEMLDVYRLRIPREGRIDAMMNEGTLIMDILNELRRCPKSVYETFSPADKKKFNKVGTNPDGSKSEMKLIRYHDRFPYLALRMIDQTNAIGDIRFHLRLGLFRYRFYNKKTISGELVNPVRTIQKEVNGFGRWQDVEECRKSLYGKYFQNRIINDDGLEQPVPDSLQSLPYITDWHASYNIHACRIGMAWNLSQMEDALYLPPLTFDDGNNRNRKAPLDMPAPMCYMSIYDIPALLFYNYLYKRYHAERYTSAGILTAESIIKNKYNALNDFFEFVTSGADLNSIKKKQIDLGLADNELPDKIRCFIGTKKLFNIDGKPLLDKNTREQRLKEWRPEAELRRHTINRLKAIIEEDTYRIESLGKKREKIEVGGRNNRYGRKGRADIRPGAIARYIIKSLMLWQPAMPVAGGGKLTSANHQALAKYLEEYGSNDESLNNLHSIFQRAGLIGGTHPHPFINKVLKQKPMSILQLYTFYLEVEKAYAERMLTEVKTNTDDITLPPFAHPNGLRWSTTLTEAAKRYTTVPNEQNDASTDSHRAVVSLPDGLFTSHIISLLRQALPHNSELEPMRKILEGNNNMLGAAYIIRFWFDQVEGDAPQAFYNNDGDQYRRFYKTLSLLNPHRMKNRQLIPDYFSESEIKELLQIMKKKNRDQLRSAVMKAYGLKENKAEDIKQRQNAFLEMLHDVSDSEQALHRYRIQDICLFLSGRSFLVDILTKSMGGNIEKKTLEKAKEMHLRDFGFDNEFEFLDNAKIPYVFKIGNMTISMPAMSFKNYGTIFRLLGDERLKQLLEGLSAMNINEVTFNDLTTEFASYDQQRIEVMKLAQDIEQMAIAGNIYLNDPDDPRFYVKDKDGNSTNLAMRNNFNSLVHLLSHYFEFADFFTELRNTIAHNRYPKKYKDAEDKNRNPYSEDLPAAGYEGVLPPNIFASMKQILEDKVSEKTN